MRHKVSLMHSIGDLHHALLWSMAKRRWGLQLNAMILQDYQVVTQASAIERAHQNSMHQDQRADVKGIFPREEFCTHVAVSLWSL